jgi:anthranilate/para-aminobenzoate synthase component I
MNTNRNNITSEIKRDVALSQQMNTKTLNLPKTTIMDIQADISWIRSELKGVRDPHLIEAFKQLLTYRKSKPDTAMSKSQFVAEIKEAEEQIENGDYLSLDEFEKSAEKWG